MQNPIIISTSRGKENWPQRTQRDLNTMSRWIDRNPPAEVGSTYAGPRDPEFSVHGLPNMADALLIRLEELQGCFARLDGRVPRLWGAFDAVLLDEHLCASADNQ